MSKFTLHSWHRKFYILMTSFYRYALRCGVSENVKPFKSQSESLHGSLLGYVISVEFSSPASRVFLARDELSVRGPAYLHLLNALCSI